MLKGGVNPKPPPLRTPLRDTKSMTPFDSHLLCAATGVQILFIIIRVNHIA